MEIEGNMLYHIGTSFEDKLYLGATIGMPHIDYREKSTYTESGFVDTAVHLQAFDYHEDFAYLQLVAI